MSATAPAESGGMQNAYRQLFELGRGGMARVHLAESLASGIRKLVVLKVLNPEHCADLDMRTSFRREAELAAQMNHPNVVQVMAVVEQSNAPVIVMEYLEGAPLSEVLKQAGQHLPLRLRMYILSQVLAGLHHFHELKDLEGEPLNAVHRDVSPQNVMVLHDGPVKVLDFGIAKVTASNDETTRTGTVKGKLRYMPPEQLFGNAGIDRRADIFAVGVMLWEAVAERRMWGGKSEGELMRSLATGALPELCEFAPNAPESVVKIVRRATDVNREHRFATALEMQVAIEQALARENWLVQSRELADFMLRHFGATRQAQQLRIKTELRAQRDSDAIARRPLSVRVANDSDEPGESGYPKTLISDLDASLTLRTPRRSWGWAFGVICCLVLAGAWGIRQQLSAHAQGADQDAQKTVALEVDVLPAKAEILLDGKPLGRGHFAGRHPVTEEKVVLQLSAPGYMREQRELSLHRDTALMIALEPEPAEPAISMSSSLARLAASAPPPPPPVPAKSASRATPKPLATAPSRKCRPPYTFSPDGVKTYKPECF